MTQFTLTAFSSVAVAAIGLGGFSLAHPTENNDVQVTQLNLDLNLVTIDLSEYTLF